MRFPMLRIGLFVLGLLAFAGDNAAQAGGRLRMYYVPDVRCAPCGTAVRTSSYTLWYRIDGDWVEQESNESHKYLFDKGYGDGHKLVHPDYWQQPLFATIFTITPTGTEPADVAARLTLFYLHFCIEGWVYQRASFDYQSLYTDGVAANRTFVGCSENCLSHYEGVFTICRAVDSPGGGYWMRGAAPSCRLFGGFRSRRGCAP